MKDSKEEYKNRKEIDKKTSYCFFAHSYVIERSEKEKRVKKDLQQYEEDKKDKDCTYARLLDLQRNLLFVWDGKDESVKDTITNPIDCKMIAALKYLNSKAAKIDKCSISDGCDYAWIKYAIDKQPYIEDPMQRFIGYTELINYSFINFVDYIKRLGFDNICEYRNLERYYKFADGKIPNCTYKDCSTNKGKAERRNRIIQSFIYIMNSPEFKKMESIDSR